MNREESPSKEKVNPSYVSSCSEEDSHHSEDSDHDVNDTDVTVTAVTVKGRYSHGSDQIKDGVEDRDANGDCSMHKDDQRECDGNAGSKFELRGGGTNQQQKCHTREGKVSGKVQGEGTRTNEKNEAGDRHQIHANESNDNETDTIVESSGDTKEKLQARVHTLEDQLTELNEKLQQVLLQQQQQQQHNQHITGTISLPGSVIGSILEGHNESTSSSSSSCSATISMHQSPSNRKGSTPTVAMIHSSPTSPPSSSSETSDHGKDGDGGDIVPARDLEYRSFTPDYEEELRKLRKTSRGLSLDHSDYTPTNGGGSLSACGSNKGSSNNLAALDEFKEEHVEEEKRTLLRKENVPPLHPSIMVDGSATNPQTNGVDETKSSTQATLARMEDLQTMPNATLVRNDIMSEGGVRDDKNQRTSKPVHKNTINMPPTSPLPNSNDNNKSVPGSPPVDEATLQHVEDKMMKTYAVRDFIKGLNIDSRQQDGSATEDVDANMEEFLRVPFRIESLLFFGMIVCIDSFLNVLTVTPLKFIWSCLCLLCTIFTGGKGIGWCRFHRRHFYQLLRIFVTFVVYKYALCPISIGKLYHWIRVQAMLKLYVLMAMVEVFDRLMCSFGQDALDSLYWNTTQRPYHPRMIASTLVVLVYAMIHSLILFVHVATLNVAMNSADSALLSLLIGGNFAEIKSTVFKKYNKQNLFKITTSDICERFKLVLFLALVLLLTCSQGGMNQEMVNDYIYMSCAILFAEMLCDWIKHSFMTKFNFIKSSVYLDYSLVLAGDVTGIGQEGMHIEHTHAVVKRLGFPQIPLVCVALRYVKEAIRYADTLKHDGDSDHVLYSFAVVWTHGGWGLLTGYIVGFFSFLLGLKFLLGYYIASKARSIFCYGPLEGYTENKKTPKRRGVV